MAEGVSVVICCYNSAERLPRTLTHLAAQRVSEKLPWEVIVIDNASQDKTGEVALKRDLIPIQYHPIGEIVVRLPLAETGGRVE